MALMKKKIIFFSRDLRIGGMEKALVMLLNRLVKEGMDITLVLEEKAGVLLTELDGCIRVKQYKLSQSKFTFFRRFFNLFHRIIWGMIHYHRYDFSCNYATYSVLGSKLATVASRNSALYVHSDYYNYFGGDRVSIKAFFLQQGIERIENIIFVAKEAMQLIKQLFPEFAPKFITLSNLIDAESILPLSNETIPYSKPKNKELIVFVGRLEEESKKLTRLIESFKYVSQNSKEFQLLIIGEGSDRKLCEELITKYNLWNQITMLGEIRNPYPYIKIADCVVLTSDYEGFPVVYNECLVLQTPIVTTIPVSDDYVDSRKFSVLVDKRPERIAEALISRAYNNVVYEVSDIEAINKRRLKEFMKIIDDERE